MLKYPCLVLDHDDTVVSSTASIHYPCFVKYLEERKPHLVGKFDLETYLSRNFDPGVIEFFTKDVGLSEKEMAEEGVLTKHACDAAEQILLPMETTLPRHWIPFWNP